MLLRSMIVVITGASKGIGKAVATAFAQKGYTLLLCSRGETALYDTVSALQLLTRMQLLKQGPPICLTKRMCMLLQLGA
jgi:short-subunit dehydrogenase